MNLKNIKFDVLLSTYNGENYIEQQLDSLFIQKDFISRVYIRDDGSVDQTINIIKKYIKLYPDLIFLVEDKKGNLGPRDSFFTLCEYVTEDFIAFCDQDDVWNSTKLKEFAIFIDNNRIDGENTKALIHCDLEVVNAELITISSSFWQLMNINNEDRIFDVLIRNTVTGCACVITKALMSEYKGDSKGFTMHDHFYAAHAALYNSIYRIPSQLIKYRQHSNNCIGTGKNSKITFFEKVITKSLKDYITAIQMRLSYDWCKLINVIHNLTLTTDNKISLDKLHKMSDESFIKRSYMLYEMCFIEKSISVVNFKKLFFRPLKIKIRNEL